MIDTLMLIAVVWIGTLIYMQQPKFGKTPTGERLAEFAMANHAWDEPLKIITELNKVGQHAVGYTGYW